VFEMEKNWHIYFKNPGDAGLATRVVWELPEGFTAEPLQWPAPVVFEENSIVSFGYPGRMALFSVLKAPQTISGDEVKISARIEWLACNEICIPGTVYRTLSLPVAREASANLASEDAAFLNTQAALVPRARGGWTFSLRGRSVALFPPDGFQIRSWPAPVFIPDDPKLFEHTAIARWRSFRLGGRKSLGLRCMPDVDPGTSITGVLLRDGRDPRGALRIHAVRDR
ncbi:MAG: protein-disulfide reductase DsbD family protein, partial [Kiritimatiellia bacterium]|nr:protein-disulfide reductase DsbD family protein [Kiritimatiellia bacterium]